jgi:putative transposase
MILTFKVKHGRDFTCELGKAHRIAEFALKTRTRSSKDVKQFGLKSAIANQILRKYSRNKKLKRVGSVKLTVPNQSIQVVGDRLNVPCLKLGLPVTFRKDFNKVNQIELDGEYAYVSVNIPDPPLKEVTRFVGLDRNATEHIAVLADPESGKVWKLGKQAQHIHNKYRAMRKTLQSERKYRELKAIKNRESRIVRDINHKVAKKIVDIAEKFSSGIKMELLYGIRKSRRHTRRFNGTLHSWSFYQLENFIAYKAKMRGIPLVYVEPRNTSKECSRCGSVGTRRRKQFVCPCGHVDHADANAGFNIALRPPLVEGAGQLHVDRDACKGSTDTPRGATL